MDNESKIETEQTQRSMAGVPRGRVGVAQQVQRNRMRCLAAFHALCMINGFSPFEMSGKKRTQAMTRQRDRMIAQLRSRGFSYPAIGYVLNRDHTSVLHSTQKRNRHDD